MTTMKALSAAMKLIDVKKENLRKAFEDLEAQSSSLSSFTLTWSDLDSYFTSIQFSLQDKFKLLQTLESQPPSSRPPPIPLSSATAVNNLTITSVRARPELKSFCQKMDGLGLRKYIIDRPKEREAIRVELLDALGSSPDAAAMILDALDGFSSTNDLDIRRACVILLEELMGLKSGIKGEVRERAMKLAVEWKSKMRSIDINTANKNNPKNTFEVLGFLLIVAVYGLLRGFNMDELVNCTLIVAKNKLAVRLCRMLNFGDRIPDLIEKLISNGKQILAIKFIFEFEMTEKFPPVPILKAYAKESKNLVQKICKTGNQHGQNEARMKEISNLKSVVKCIDEYKLDSEYPKKNILLQRIEKLEKEKVSKKRAAAAAPSSVPEKQPKAQREGIIKRSQTEPADPASNPTSATANLASQENVTPRPAIPLYQQPPLQTEGLLAAHPDQYFASPAGSFAMAVSNSTIAQYSGTSSGKYEFSGTPMNVNDNGSNLYPSGSLMAGFNPAIAPSTSSSSRLYELSGVPMCVNGPTTRSNLYPTESHMPYGYYDGKIAYGGYGLPPEYHPSYHPQ